MKLARISIALMVTAMMASCSTIQNMMGTNKKSVKSETVKPDIRNEKGKTGVESSVGGHRPTSEQLSGGQWSITAVGDAAVSPNEDDEMPYVNFQPSTGRFYASDGCNIINGDYVMLSDGTMKFSNVLSTMKYCPDVEHSASIAAVLNDGFKVKADCRTLGQETYLYLRTPDGKPALTLRRHNMEFLNGNWQVTDIDGKSINDEECNIFIDIAELKIHGNTGCNFFNGDIYIDPTRSNAIDFSNMGLTRMACNKSEQESAMILALERTATAIAGKNDDSVMFLDAKGKRVMILKRIPLPEKETAE